MDVQEYDLTVPANRRDLIHVVDAKEDVNRIAKYYLKRGREAD